MDGLSVGRAAPAAPRIPSPAAPPAPTSRYASPTDRLALGAGASPVGGSAPLGAAPGASAEQLIAEVSARLQGADGLEAQRLTTFAAVVASTAADPRATAALAQAWRTPQAGEGAQRLAALFFEGDETTLSQLYFTAAVDDPEVGERLHAAFPNSIFSADRSGASVLAALVREVHDPQAVVQGDKQTCGAASAQILLARNGPAEYVKLMTGLAFEGQATLANGGTLVRPDGWDAGIAADKRLVTGCLLQPALMDYANGMDRYDARTDRTIGETSGTARLGLASTEMQTLLEGLAGRPSERTIVKDFRDGAWQPAAPEAEAAALARIRAMAAEGWSVPVLLSVAPDRAFGHYQIVTRIEGDTVYGLNPWGREEPMPLDLFRQRLVGAFF